jgi:hypothetical protein
MWFRVDADGRDFPGMRQGRRPVSRTVRQAAHHAGRPLRGAADTWQGSDSAGAQTAGQPRMTFGRLDHRPPGNDRAGIELSA